MAALAGKVAIVTGAASLIGIATVERLVGAGARVVAGDVNAAAGRDVEAAAGDAGRYLVGDVTDEAYLDRLVAAARR